MFLFISHLYFFSSNSTKSHKLKLAALNDSLARWTMERKGTVSRGGNPHPTRRRILSTAETNSMILSATCAGPRMKAILN
jgi:hypothetical protein